MQDPRQFAIDNFLKPMLEHKVHATAIVRYERDDKEIIQVTSNGGEAGTTRDLEWAAGIAWAKALDDKFAEAMARGVLAHLGIPGFGNFDRLQPDMKKRVLAAVRTGFTAVKALQAATVTTPQIVAPS